MLRSIEAVIFDFDGTLAVLNIDFALMRNRILELIESHGVDRGEIRSRYALEMIEEAKILLNGKNPAAAQNFLREANLAITEIELEASDRGSLLPGIIPMLTELKEYGYSVGIVSRNCEKAIKKVFPDIESHCRAFLPRDRVERVKPDPEHLNAALGLLGVDGCQTAYVGDHLMDVNAGKQAFISTIIGVLTGPVKEGEFKEAGADLVLQTAAHLTNHLPKINPVILKSPPPQYSSPSPEDAGH